jgi:hypothetical protein
VGTLLAMVQIKSLMKMFDGGKLEHKTMEKSGCLNYATTTWEPLKPDVFERRLSYKFNRHVSAFGGDVTCTQQKLPIPESKGWTVNEVMTLHGVPFGDHFHVGDKKLIDLTFISLFYAFLCPSSWELHGT